MGNDKLDKFIDEHRLKRAVEHKVAKRDCGLDLLSARAVDSPGKLRGTLVVKTWASCSLIWAYVIDGGGELWDFPLYKRHGGEESPFALAQGIPLGAEIEATFRAAKSNRAYCKAIAVIS